MKVKLYKLSAKQLALLPKSLAQLSTSLSRAFLCLKETLLALPYITTSFYFAGQELRFFTGGENVY